MTASHCMLPFAAAALFLCMAADAHAQTCGDVNGDELVLASDSLAVLKKAVGQEIDLTCTDQCAALEARVAQLEALLASFSIVGGDTVVVSGMNFQVVNGSGSTPGGTNGLGNLIVGYNEGTNAQERTGSHNIIVGREHEYTSFGGLVAGAGNTISGPEATVTGGSENTASGDQSSVAGGSDNLASQDYAVVSGGFQNHASGVHSAISGGCENTATSTFTAVSGGQKNDATAAFATVSGGFNHTSGGQHDWRAGTLFETQ